MPTIPWFLILPSAILSLPLAWNWGRNAWRGDRRSTILLLIFFAGTALRIFYVWLTPVDVRSYDWEGHLEYIDYVYIERMLPPFDQGWQFYQAPLYYVLAAMWMQAGALLGMADAGGDTLTFIQVLSLCISILTLRALLWVGALLWKHTSNLSMEMLFATKMAFFSGIVMLAPRVSNDTLSFLFSTLTLGALLRWQSAASWASWAWIWALVGLGLLTKNSALLLVPAAGLAMLVSTRLSVWRKFQQTAVAAMIALAVAGWHTIPRAIEELRADSFPIGNIQSLHPDLMVGNGADAYFIFRPAQVVLDPFNDTWIDDHGRQYFWEFFFKSAFFGEFWYSDRLLAVASVIALHGLVVVLLSVIGWIALLRARNPLLTPVSAVMFFVLAGQLLLRFRLPFSPSQDFRFSLLLAPCIAALAIHGCLRLPEPLRAASESVLWAIALLQIGFIVGASLLA